MWFPISFSWGFFVPYLVTLHCRDGYRTGRSFKSSFSRFTGRKVITKIVHGRIPAFLVAWWYLFRLNSRTTDVMAWSVTPHVEEQQTSA